MTALPRRGQAPSLPERNRPDAILLIDHDASFCEALRNFLLAAGRSRVEVAATARAAFPRLRQDDYEYVLIGVSQPFSRALRLANIAQRRQRDARILFLLNAKDQPSVRDGSRDYVIKEYVFSNLLDLM